MAMVGSNSSKFFRHSEQFCLSVRRSTRFKSYASHTRVRRRFERDLAFCHDAQDIAQAVVRGLIEKVQDAIRVREKATFKREAALMRSLSLAGPS